MLIASFGLLTILEKLNLPMNNLFWKSVYNFGHVPLFGFLSLLILGLAKQVVKFEKQKHYLYYVIAFISVIFIGAISEFLQLYGPRDADIGDWIRDIIGAISFLGCYMAYDKKAGIISDKSNDKYKIIIILIATVLIILSFIPTALWAGAYLHRNHEFPVICSFDSFWERKFIKTRNADLTAVSSPKEWRKYEDDRVGQLILYPANYSGFSIEEPYPDWSDYDFLSFEVYSKLDSSINLAIRIEDIYHDDTYQDRFNKSNTINPGINRIVIPLTEIKEAPASRMLDMTAIRYIHVFTANPDNIILYIDDFRLYKN